MTADQRAQLLELRRKRFGLGDAVARVAQPIAGVIDVVAGTQLQGCGGCARRQAALNRLMPDLRHPLQGQNEKPPVG